MALLRIALLFICCCVPVVTLAQTATDEFTVRVFAGEDTEPPTTPVLLSATAVSPTQVDLTWSSVTDNFVLGGYVVWRDGAALATTSLTTFADTGLLASTTYTYTVRAFDTSSNYSSSSNSIAVTTPNPPAPVILEPTIAGGEGTITRVVPEELVIETDVNNAYFTIMSAMPARYSIRWGRTASYELGYLSSDIVRREYHTVVSDLEPGTTYEYELVGFTPRGRQGFLERGQFTTVRDIDLTAPANVRRFEATSIGNDVLLEWDMPGEEVDFVRIVRSHLGYPMHPTDGAIVYQGAQESAVDVGVLQNYSPAYYTAFVYDRAGNVSSGAVAVAYAEMIVDTGILAPDSGGVGISLPPLATTTQRMPDAFEVLIKQANKTASFGDEVVTLFNDEPFLLHLDASRVTTNLKSIIVQLQDPTDQRKSFSFLLRLNKDQTAYEAVVAPLSVVGSSAIVASIYDFRSLRVAEYRTTLRFEEPARTTTAAQAEEADVQLLFMFTGTVVILLLGFVLWVISRDRSSEDNETHATEKSAV